LRTSEGVNATRLIASARSQPLFALGADLLETKPGEPAMVAHRLQGIGKMCTDVYAEPGTAAATVAETNPTIR